LLFGAKGIGVDWRVRAVNSKQNASFYYWVPIPASALAGQALRWNDGDTKAAVFRRISA